MKNDLKNRPVTAQGKYYDGTPTKSMLPINMTTRVDGKLNPMVKALRTKMKK